MALLFLTALAVAFSGAMMPGPLLTYTISQSLNNGPYSGLIIIIGHAILELVLIVLIFLGFDIILQSNIAQIIIGIVGGALLIYMGVNMIIESTKNKIRINISSGKTNKKNMIIAGFVISAANPYFLLWWVVIGLGFLLQAYKSFDIAGVTLFYVGHISADFIWYGLISVVVGKTRKFIKENIYRFIIIVLGCLLIFFGGGFVYDAIKILI